jgi:Flp pilus assembly protein TadG
MAALNRILKRLGRNESGAELVEFALTLPLLLLLVLGMIEFGFLFQEYEVVTNAAREGARIAVLPTYSQTPADQINNATARVNEYLNDAGLNSSLPGVTVTVGPPTRTDYTAPATGCVWSVPVTVTYPHPVPFISGIMSYFGTTIGQITLRTTSRMRTEASGTCP